MKQKYLMPDGEIVEHDRPQFKTPYNHDTNFESDRTAWYSTEPSLTKQEFKDDVDINVIIKRALATGEPPPMALPEHFADIPERISHFEMASKVAEANALFYELPAEKRAVFQNDPTRWADQVLDALDRGDVKALNAMGIDAKANHKPQDGDSKGGNTTPVTPPTNAAPAAPAAATAAGTPPAAATQPPKT